MIGPFNSPQLGADRHHGQRKCARSKHRDHHTSPQHKVFRRENFGKFRRRQLFENPALIPAAAEELIRRHQLTNLGRVVVRDVEYKDVQFKAGDFVLAIFALAGLDERRYPDPMTVDFNRADKKHLAFGTGPHQCIGSFLARTEIRVFLSEWLKRIPDFEVKSGDEPIMQLGKSSRVSYLPLTWDPQLAGMSK